MLNFINTLVLPLLAAALIPLILHLFNRKKLKIIPFSSVRFLKELQNKRLRQIKLYQILIILLRMLFIVFLVMAFARPTMRHFFPAGNGTARTTAVIILDDSYSMQTQQGMQSFFSRARESMKTILNSFEKRDHISVLIPLADSLLKYEVGPNQPLPWSRIKASNFSPNFSSAFLSAQKIFRQFPNYNRELYFITDMQISSKALNDSAMHVLKRLKARIYIVDVTAGKIANNVSIDSAAVQNQLVELHKPVSIVATLENHNEEPKEITVSLFDGSVRLAMQLVKLPAKNKRQVRLQFLPNHTGFFPLKLEIDDDDLLADNTYYLSLFIPEKIPILYVQNQTPLELHEALKTLSEHTNLNIKQTNYDRWYGEPLSEYQLLILNDPPQITNSFLLQIKQFLASGHNLILIPGASVTPTDYNRITNEILGKNLFKELIKSESNERFFSLSPTIEGNQILTDLFNEKPKNSVWPPFYRYFKLLPAGKILLRFNTGDPFLCRISLRKKSDVWLFSAGLTLPWSPFPLSGIFLPFMHRIISLASNIKQSQAHFLVGTPFSVYLNSTTMSGDFQLTPPEGEAMIVIPKETSNGLRFDFDGFSQPGHYKILHGGKPVGLFAVNLSAREWARPFIDWTNLRNDLQRLTFDKLSPKVLKAARTGHELWPYFLILALLMFLLEMYFIRKLEGHPAPQ